MLKVTQNFLRNSKEILEEVEKNHSSLFSKREGEDSHAGFIPGILSNFKTLKNENMNERLINLIFRDNDFSPDLRDFYEFIQIQKYEPGDYIVPHRDSYRVRKLHLITLTTSNFDGLVCEENRKLIFVPDIAGQYVDFPYTAAHYVSPVKELRYTMVIGE
jgi:hypothetical protein